MLLFQLSQKKTKQGGFTLLELLISVVLMLGIVIVVQRYVAGVVVDQAAVHLRQDQSSQIQASLTSLKRDVAQAGSYPVATTAGAALFAPVRMSLLNAGVAVVPCAPANCVGDQLNVASVMPVGAADCHGNAVQYTVGNGLLNSGWVFVYNQYAFVNEGGLLHLTCLGNGAAPSFGWRGILSDVVGFQFSQTGINGSVRLIGLCLVTSDASGLNDGSATLTDCAGNNLPVGSVFYKTRIDMPVNHYAFTAT